MPGTPSWVPLIDACMSDGGDRNQCIRALPDEELMKLEAWERRQALGRRALLTRDAIGTTSDKTPTAGLSAPGKGIDWNVILSLPREEAIALAYSSEYRPYAPGILGLTLQRWAQEDPQAAYERLAGLSADFEIQHLESQIIRLWLMRDPHGALDVAAASEHPNVFILAMLDYAYLDPEGALAAAPAYHDLLGEDGRMNLVRGVASTRPRLAADYVSSLGSDGEHLVDAIIEHLQVEDPEAAMDWLLANYPGHRNYDALATFFFIHDPEAAFEYLERMNDQDAWRSFAHALCQARETNEASRAASSLAQPRAGYDQGICAQL